MNCIRKDCKNKAIVHQTFGVLPCLDHQQSDERVLKRKFEFANVSKLHRIQEQRDNHGQDLVQPYVGNKANPEFFKQFPEKVKDYNVGEELAKV